MLNKNGLKYVLIVSQYYHSRHSFIVQFDENTFIENARLFVGELEEYKRNPFNVRDFNFGDLDERWVGEEFRSRYNVNDEGDIYFILSPYANYCMGVAEDYLIDSIREEKGYKRKDITEKITKHHNYHKVNEIVEKFFTIA